MNIAEVEAALRRFMARHRTVFSTLGTRQAQTLELAALMTVVTHYEHRGYRASAENLRSGAFRVKLTTRGALRNFSFYRVTRQRRSFDIYTNLPVGSDYRADSGIYVVDVAVIEAGVVPPNASDDWYLANDNLVTFAEVKNLVIYPMLLAQFIGIVHELQPSFLGGGSPDAAFAAAAHAPPTLLSVGYLQGRSRPIVDAYPVRGFGVRIVPNLDREVAAWRAPRWNRTCPLCSVAPVGGDDAT